MKSLLRFYILLCVLVGVGRAADINEPVVAKIVVKEDGAVFFDGKKISVRELDTLLTPIKEKKGVVWYYRANPQAEPNRAAMEALNIVVTKQLPMKLFSKEDFSEYVGADGKSHKQKRE